MIGGRHKSGLGRKGRKKELLGGSVITERLYIDVKQEFKKKKKKKLANGSLTVYVH